MATTNRIQDLLEGKRAPTVLPEANRLTTFFEGGTFQRLLEEALEHGRRQGRAEVINEYLEQAQKALGAYVYRIIWTAGLVCDVAKELLRDVKIEDARTKFEFEAQRHRLFFLIDSSFEDETKFLVLLNRVQKKSITETGVAFEFLCLNQREKTIDFDAIKVDFPHALKLEGLEHVVQTTTHRSGQA